MGDQISNRTPRHVLVGSAVSTVLSNLAFSSFVLNFPLPSPDLTLPVSPWIQNNSTLNDRDRAKEFPPGHLTVLWNSTRSKASSYFPMVQLPLLTYPSFLVLTNVDILEFSIILTKW